MLLGERLLKTLVVVVAILAILSIAGVNTKTALAGPVSVPAGVLAQAGIENFASRQKILVQTTVRLRYATSTHQLKHILDRVRELLARSPKIEQTSARS